MQYTYPALLVGNKQLKHLSGAQVKKEKSLSFLEEGLCIGPQVSLVSGVVFVCFAYMLLYEMKQHFYFLLYRVGT